MRLDITRLMYTFFASYMTLCSCGQLTGSDEMSEAGKNVSIRLNPASGTIFQYSINNKTSVKAEVNDNTITNENESDVVLRYTSIDDSLNEFRFLVNYDKIKLRTVKAGVESNFDASNSGSVNQIEKMLNLLTRSTIKTRISKSGKVLEVSGYRELGNELFKGVHDGDPQMKEILLQQWDKVITEELVRKNLDQFFHILPDSAVHVGQTWKLASTQTGEIPVTLQTVYKVVSVKNDVARLSADGIVSNEQSKGSVMGYSNVNIELKGTQKGTFDIDVISGMMIGADLESEFEGDITIMGRIVPIKLSIAMNLKGNRLK